MLGSECATLERRGSHRETRGTDATTDVLADGDPGDDRASDGPMGLPTTGDPCPFCGTEIRGMDVAGPSDITLLPCGHTIGGRGRR